METDVKTVFLHRTWSCSVYKNMPGFVELLQDKQIYLEKISPTLFIKGHGYWVDLKLAPVFFQNRVIIGLFISFFSLFSVIIELFSVDS